MASGNAACLHWPQQHYQLQLVDSQLGYFGVMRQYSSLMFGSGSAAEVVAILQQKADCEVELLSQVTLWPVSAAVLRAATRAIGFVADCLG